jgi:hypothetical protein
MSVVSLAILKSYFETGDKPTQGEFADLIDTLGAWIGTYVPFKLELTTANLLAGGDFDITELPAPGAGFAWKVIDCEMEYTFNSVAFDNLDISVQSESGRSQFSILAAQTSAYSGNHFGNLVMQNPLDDGDQTIVVENEKMIAQLSTSTVGNGSIIIYGMARKITL